MLELSAIFIAVVTIMLVAHRAELRMNKEDDNRCAQCGASIPEKAKYCSTICLERSADW